MSTAVAKPGTCTGILPDSLPPQTNMSATQASNMDGNNIIDICFSRHAKKGSYAADGELYTYINSSLLIDYDKNGAKQSELSDNTVVW